MALVFLTVLAVGKLSSGEALPAPPPAKLPPLTVLSIIPAQGEPGMVVTLNGTGFTGATTAFLGTHELPTAVGGGKVLSFELPELAPGVYALYLRREDGATSKAFNFMLQPQRPQVSALSPDNVPTCAFGREREVVLTGANFLEGAQVLFDGAAVPTRRISSSALSFSTPPVAAGLHQVQAKNNSDALSGALGLMVESKPEILNVAVGKDYVVYYELVISGRNFQQASVLVVDGERVGTGLPASGNREQMVYLGCAQLIYQRHPYDSTPRQVTLQVVNPNGEESNAYTISTP